MPFSDYLGQHWSETFRTSRGRAATKQDDALMHLRGLFTKYGESTADVVKLTRNAARRKAYKEFTHNAVPQLPQRQP